MSESSRFRATPLADIAPSEELQIHLPLRLPNKLAEPITTWECEDRDCPETGAHTAKSYRDAVTKARRHADANPNHITRAQTLRTQIFGAGYS